MSRSISRSEVNSMLGSHFAKHLRGLQFILKSRFGMKATSESGENTIYIGPDKIDMTNAEGTIVARGPARVATVLVRRKRKRK